MSELRLILAERAEHRCEVARLRTVHYAPRFPDAAPWWLDEDRDRLSHIFLLYDDERPVATARIIPTSSGRSELQAMDRVPSRIEMNERVWELGRVAAMPMEAGVGLSYAPVLFVWASAWAQYRLPGHPPVEAVIAYCRRSKVDGFVAYGAQVIDGPYPVPGKGNVYYTIYAPLNAVVERAHAYGLTHLVSAAVNGINSIPAEATIGSFRSLAQIRRETQSSEQVQNAGQIKNIKQLVDGSHHANETGQHAYFSPGT